MRHVIKRSQVEVEEPSPTRARERAPRAAAARACAARVRLVEIDATTRALEFTCSCGEVSLIEIQCGKTS